MTLEVFDESWIATAKECSVEPWVAVMEDLNNTGRIYLDSLQKLFDEFPLTNKQKRNLKNSLESFKNEDHLGGVNELAWWAFMRQDGLEVNPVPASNVPKPDFQVVAPVKFFVEVSTLNVSDEDKLALENGNGIPLNPSEDLRRLRRFIGKAKDTAKQRQMLYACGEKQPCVLVIFDYTEWTGYGTQFFRFLGNHLFGEKLGFQELPCELSALVYAERHVRNGPIEFTLSRSAIYYNPNAKYPLEEGTFSTLNQFSARI